MSERWKEICGFEGLYEISDLGRIRGIERKVASKNGSLRVVPSKIKALMSTSNGYCQVVLHNQSKRCRFLVHRLVLINFIGPPIKDRNQSNHKNGNKSDNRLDNLEWVNSSENMRHAIDILGRRSLYGESNPASKLTKKDVIKIRDGYFNGGLSQQNLSNKFGVSQTQIGKIIRRDQWKEIE